MDATVPQFSTDAEIARVAAANQAQVDALKGHPTTKAERQLLAVAKSYVRDQHAYHRIAWPASVPATGIVSEKTPFPTAIEGGTQPASRHGRPRLPRHPRRPPRHR
ncbi:MAG TPA: hypothetical protein VGL93_11695 [Streptosporangiaceae bacterium]